MSVVRRTQDDEARKQNATLLLRSELLKRFRSFDMNQNVPLGFIDECSVHFSDVLAIIRGRREYIWRFDFLFDAEECLADDGYEHMSSDELLEHQVFRNNDRIHYLLSQYVLYDYLNKQRPRTMYSILMCNRNLYEGALKCFEKIHVWNYISFVLLSEDCNELIEETVLKVKDYDGRTLGVFNS